MQKNKDKAAKNLPVKKDDNDLISKTKPPADNAPGKKSIDEQNSDGSGGAFEEFIDLARRGEENAEK